MATIENRGPYQWRVKIRRKGYPSQTKTLESKQEAEAWARHVESEMDRGVFTSRVKAEKTTLDKLIHRYIEEVAITHRGYEPERLRLLALSRRPIACMLVACIRSEDVAKYRDQRLREVKPETVIKELNLISNILDVARREWGVYTENPVKDVRRPAKPQGRERRLEGDEEARLLAALDMCRNPWIKTIVIIAVETAMRRGEILSLRWENIDFDKHTAFLPHTKNGQSRAIPLSEGAEKALKALPRSLNGQVVPGNREQLEKSV